MMNGVNQISIMGMGLMGASLAAALKDSAYSGKVIGWARRDEVCEAAKRSGWFDSVMADASAAVAEASRFGWLEAPNMKIFACQGGDYERAMSATHEKLKTLIFPIYLQ